MLLGVKKYMSIDDIGNNGFCYFGGMPDFPESQLEYSLVTKKPTGRVVHTPCKVYFDSRVIKMPCVLA